MAENGSDLPCRALLRPAQLRSLCNRALTGNKHAACLFAVAAKQGNAILLILFFALGLFVQ